MTQSWPWDSQIAVKKDITFMTLHILKLEWYYSWSIAAAVFPAVVVYSTDLCNWCTQLHSVLACANFSFVYT